MAHQLFKLTEGCHDPMLLRRDGQYLQVPCNKCPKCYDRKVNQWAFRLMYQNKVSPRAHFITLTYSDENLKYTFNGLMDLCKRDVQLFMKRLRKENKGVNLKYYACGEYGSESDRPHYHMILFDATVESVLKCWKLGHVHFDVVNEGTIKYTLKYMAKPSKIPLSDWDDRTKEFPLMSKGIGISYVNNEKLRNWHYKDVPGRLYVNLEDGKKMAMPRYFKDKIYNRDQRLEQKAKFTEAFRISMDSATPCIENWEILWNYEQARKARKRKFLNDALKRKN